MKKQKKLGVLSVIFIIALALPCLVKAQTPGENMKTFFDSEITGIKVQVNATAETQPTQNITVTLRLTAKNDVTVVNLDSLNLSIFGFLNGTDEILMESIQAHDLSLNPMGSIDYNRTFEVPERVWDTTYGEIVLNYSVTYGGVVTLHFNQLTLGFTMTQVENVYLNNLEIKYQELNNSYLELNRTYWLLNSTYQKLNQTFWQLERNYTSLKGSAGELSGTRTVAAVLGVTTVFFGATTAYTVKRRPKEYV
jgi:hypothetical protein